MPAGPRPVGYVLERGIGADELLPRLFRRERPGGRTLVLEGGKRHIHQPLMLTEFGGKPVAGGTLPAQIWHAFMTAADKQLEEQGGDFEGPMVAPFAYSKDSHMGTTGMRVASLDGAKVVPETEVEVTEIGDNPIEPDSSDAGKDAPPASGIPGQD